MIAVRNRTLAHPHSRRRSRARWRSLSLGPLDDARRRRLGVRPAVPRHAAPPARPGLLVARRRAAAARRRRRARLRARRRAGRRSRTSRRRRTADAAARRARPLAVRDRLPPARAAACSRRRRRAGGLAAQRAWRAYLWPSLAFALGVFMWPVMVFFTNSTIHMLAHGAWAQVMMLAGAAELGLVRGKLHEPVLAARRAARVRRLRRRVPGPRAERLALPALRVPPPRARLDVVVGALFPLGRGVRPRSLVVATRASRSIVRRGRGLLFCDRDVAPIFGHLSPLAGAPHR